MLKAAWTWADGNAEDKGVQTCAESLVKVLINIAGSLTTRGKAAESEAILREALEVSYLSIGHLLHLSAVLALLGPETSDMTNILCMPVCLVNISPDLYDF